MDCLYSYMDYIAFKGLIKSVNLWCELCSRRSADAEDLFLNSIDNLNKFRGLEVFRGKLLESTASDAEKFAREALLVLQKLMDSLENNHYDGDLEIKIAYSTLKSDISGALSEVQQFLQNINNT